MSPREFMAVLVAGVNESLADFHRYGARGEWNKAQMACSDLESYAKKLGELAWDLHRDQAELRGLSPFDQEVA